MASNTRIKSELGPFLLKNEERSLRTGGLVLIALTCANIAAVVDTKYDLDRGLTPAQIESQAKIDAQTSLWGAVEYVFGNYGRRTMCERYKE